MEFRLLMLKTTVRKYSIQLCFVDLMNWRSLWWLLNKHGYQAEGKFKLVEIF